MKNYLKELIKKAIERANKEVLKIEERTDISIEEKSSRIIIIFSTSCASVATQPLPFADFYFLTTIQGIMGERLSSIHGIPLSEKEAKDLVLEIGGIVGLGKIAETIVLGLYKINFPGIAGFTTFPWVFALTYGIGKVMDTYLIKKAKGETLSKIDIKDIYSKAKKEGKKRSKESKNEVKSIKKDLDQELKKKEKKEEKKDEYLYIAMKKLSDIWGIETPKDVNRNNLIELAQKSMLGVFDNKLSNQELSEEIIRRIDVRIELDSDWHPRRTKIKENKTIATKKNNLYKSFEKSLETAKKIANAKIEIDYKEVYLGKEYKEKIQKRLKRFLNDGDPIGCIGVYKYEYGSCELCSHTPIKWHYMLKNYTTNQVMVAGSECVNNYQVILQEWGYSPAFITFPFLFKNSFTHWIKNPKAIVFNDDLISHFELNAIEVFKNTINNEKGLKFLKSIEKDKEGKLVLVNYNNDKDFKYNPNFDNDDIPF